MYRILAQSFPNNEIRVVFSALPAVRPLNGGCEDEFPSPAIDDSRTTEDYDSEKESPPLSLVPNSKPDRKLTGYGDLPLKPTVFGLNARRKIVRSGAAMEKSIESPSECLFLTGTLPGSTPEAFAGIAAYSAYIVNNLKAWIAKRVSSKLDFYCWEYQRRGALHLHYCIHVPNDCDRKYIVSGFRDWWINTLIRVGEKFGCDLFRKNDKFTHLDDLSKVRAVAEVCRKSPARYMAKYLSKSAQKLKGRACFFTPSRWWGVSRPLKSLLDSLSKTVEIISATYLGCLKTMQDIKHVTESSEGLRYAYPHMYGLGETLLNYPTNEESFDQLFHDIESMSVMSKMNTRISAAGMTATIRPYKIRLLRWSSDYSQSLQSKDPQIAEVLSLFHTSLMPISPSTSESPIHAMYEFNNLVFNVREACIRTPALWNRNDIELFELALFDIEATIKLLAYNGDKWMD